MSFRVYYRSCLSTAFFHLTFESKELNCIPNSIYNGTHRLIFLTNTLKFTLVEFYIFPRITCH